MVKGGRLSKYQIASLLCSAEVQPLVLCLAFHRGQLDLKGLSGELVQLFLLLLQFFKCFCWEAMITWSLSSKEQNYSFFSSSRLMYVNTSGASLRRVWRPLSLGSDPSALRSFVRCPLNWMNYRDFQKVPMSVLLQPRLQFCFLDWGFWSHHFQPPLCPEPRATWGQRYCLLAEEDFSGVFSRMVYSGNRSTKSDFLWQWYEIWSGGISAVVLSYLPLESGHPSLDAIQTDAMNCNPTVYFG